MNSVTERRLRFVSGNQMIAYGAVAAGCRFFAGYPITPASGIYRTMIEELQGRGDVAISAPDEISALAYCVGASMAGHKAMTATSGPGWALMVETFQYALMTETPVVVVLVQRLGPSTGGATQGAQGDVLFSEYSVSGGYTVPVLCPSNVAECYDLTIEAFAWAERLRSPVILLSDKEVGMMNESVDVGILRDASDVKRPMSGGSLTRKMYDFVHPADIPAFRNVGGDQKVTATGSAHNKSGELRKNDPETMEVLLHLEEKIAARTSELAITRLDEQTGARTLVVSYGITARAAREAAKAARMCGKKVSVLSIQSLFPVPEDRIRQALSGIDRVVVAEENFGGQYRSCIDHLCAGREMVGVNRIGSMITPGEIEAAIV